MTPSTPQSRKSPGEPDRRDSSPMAAENLALHGDRLLDANLRVFGAQADHPGLESPLTDELLASFKNKTVAGQTAEPRLAIGARSVVLASGEGRPGAWVSRRKLMAGLSAAAAMIAVGAVIFNTHAPTSRVNAAAILSSLRTRSISGVNIVFNHLRAEGASIDGIINVRLDPALDVDTILDEGFEPDTQRRSAGSGGVNRSIAAATLNITAHDPEIEGMEFRVDLGFQSDRKWVFLRNTRVPDAKHHPDASGLALVAMLTRGGVMLDLSDLHPGSFEPLTDSADAAAETRTLQFGDTDADPRGTVSLNLGISSKHGGGRGTMSFRPSIGSPARAGLQIPDNFRVMIRQLLNGGAGADQLLQFEQTLERAGQTATVEDLGSGRYLLITAPPADGPDGCGIGTVQITYMQDVGVQMVELVPRAPATGSITITFDDQDIDPSRLDPAGLVTAQTMTIDSHWIRAWHPDR